MSDERKQKVNIPNSNSDSSSDSETPPPAYNAPAFVADNTMGNSLMAKIFYYLSLETDQEDDEDDGIPPHPPCDGPPEPSDEQDGNAEHDVGQVEVVEEVEEEGEEGEELAAVEIEEVADVVDIDEKISKIEGIENVVPNSPSWYLHIKPHLTQDELKELWDRTAWGIKWFWDDDLDDDEDEYGNQEKGKYIIQGPFF